MEGKCTNPRLGKLIAMYEFGALDKSDQLTFFGHMIECEYCHDQVYSMGPVATAFRNHRTDAQRTRTDNPVAKPRSSVGVLSWAFNHMLPLAVSVALIIVGALVVWRVVLNPTPPAETASVLSPNGGSETDPRWADIKLPKPEYTAPEKKVLLREPEKIFVRAMAAYQRDDLDTAIEQLQTLSEMQPDNPGEVSFYEGVSLLLAGRSKEAIAPLRRAVEIGDSSQIEKSHYYLALAYLKRNQPQQAIEELDAITESGSEYLIAARQLREKISDLRSN